MIIIICNTIYNLFWHILSKHWETYHNYLGYCNRKSKNRSKGKYSEY